MQPDRTELLVLGNGPSLRNVDFGALSDRSTLGMNAAYRYWRRIDWRPTYYCCLDDALIDTHGSAINELIEEGRIERFFLTARILEHYPHLTSDPRVQYLDEFVRHWHEVRGRFHGLKYRPNYAFKTADPNMLTTGAYAVRFAAMHGFTDIELLGIDLNYQTLAQARKLSGTRLVVDTTPDTNPNYFFSDYQQAGDEFNIPNPDEHGRDLHLHSFIALRDDFISNQMNVRVSNGTTSSRLFAEATLPLTSASENRELSEPFLLRLNVKEPERLSALLWLWRQPAFFPCLRAPLKTSVDLWVHCEPEHRHEIVKETRRYLKRNSIVRRCFKTVSFAEERCPNASQYDHSYSIDDETVPISCDWLHQLQASALSEDTTIELAEAQGTMDHLLAKRQCAPKSLFFKSELVQNNLPTLKAADEKPTLRTLLSLPDRKGKEHAGNTSSRRGSLRFKPFRR